jgi:hypothetical protein
MSRREGTKARFKKNKKPLEKQSKVCYNKNTKGQG